MTEVEKLTQWIKQEQANGLVDMHVSWAPGSKDVDVEGRAKELNQVIKSLENGETVDREDVF